MKIGVGVITMGLRPLKDYLLKDGVDFFVYKDEERKGPAHGRNKVLEHFDGYDHIFIFDDDAWPLMRGWEDYFIEQAVLHNVHYMAIPEWFKGDIVGCQGEMLEWSDSLAAITYQSKHAVEVIGGYNTAYERYGYEDIARNFRAVHKAGLSTRQGVHCFPARGPAYIYYSDAYGTTEVANLTPEEKAHYTEKNYHLFQEEINSDRIYYPFRSGEQVNP